MLYAASLEIEFKGAIYKIASPTPERFLPFLKDLSFFY